MTHTLYVYEHCPYCVKARMIFGLKNIPVTVKYILNDDIETPTRMVGKKMVPILQKPDGSYMPESMDIVHYADALDGTPMVSQPETHAALEQWFAEAKTTIYSLAMPRWVRMTPPLPEFETQGAIDYFTQKKQSALGADFASLHQQSEALISKMNAHLRVLSDLLKSEESFGDTLSEYDFAIYANLHSLSAVKGLEYPEKLRAYRDHYARISKVALLTNKAL